LRNVKPVKSLFSKKDVSYARQRNTHKFELFQHKLEGKYNQVGAGSCVSNGSLQNMIEKRCTNYEYLPDNVILLNKFRMAEVFCFKHSLSPTFRNGDSNL
jgi:hypothetical protein